MAHLGCISTASAAVQPACSRTRGRACVLLEGIDTSVWEPKALASWLRRFGLSSALGRAIIGDVDAVGVTVVICCTRSLETTYARWGFTRTRSQLGMRGASNPLTEARSDMPTINWDTVVTSGATAVFVTLAIEYLAKPRMEARKERYFGILRARQELLTVITKSTLAAKMYEADLPATARTDLQRAWNAERDRQYEVLQSQSRMLMDDVARFAQAYPGQFREALIAYVTTVHGIMLSMRPRHKKATQIAGLGIPITTALEVPPAWKIWALAKMLLAHQKVHRMLTKIGDGSVVLASTPAEAASRPDPR